MLVVTSGQARSCSPRPLTSEADDPIESQPDHVAGLAGYCTHGDQSLGCEDAVRWEASEMVDGGPFLCSSCRSAEKRRGGSGTISINFLTVSTQFGHLAASLPAAWTALMLDGSTAAVCIATALEIGSSVVMGDGHVYCCCEGRVSGSDRVKGSFSGLAAERALPWCCVVLM